MKVFVGHCKVLALYFGQENDISKNMCYLEWTLSDEGGLLRKENGERIF